MISHFPKVWTIGKREIQNIFIGEVEITEKIDGSQFAFGIDENGDIIFRSKGKVQHFEVFDKMFNKAVDYLNKYKTKILEVLPKNTYIYCEYLQKPKHNVLNYEKVPKNNLIVFGVKEELNFVIDYDKIKEYADKLDLETTPLLYQGTISLARTLKGSYKGYDFIKRMINTTFSILGKEMIEGVVIKNYNQLTTIGDPTICCGKFVREAFKERHHTEWKAKGSDFETWLQSFKTEGRWQKAIIHLKEKGELENSPRDIGKIIKEIHNDIIEEETNEIKEYLYKQYINKIKRIASSGVAEWYKDKLLKSAFEEGNIK